MKKLNDKRIEYQKIMLIFLFDLRIVLVVVNAFCAVINWVQIIIEGKS